MLDKYVEKQCVIRGWKSVRQECGRSVSSKSMRHEYQIIVSGKRMRKECGRSVCNKSVRQEFRRSVFNKGLEE